MTGLVCISQSFATGNIEKDTVVIELENNSRIIIYTDNKEELKKLTKYDINQMIKDLNISVEEGDQKYVEITGDTDRYVKDTTIVYQGGSDEKF